MYLLKRANIELLWANGKDQELVIDQRLMTFDRAVESIFKVKEYNKTMQKRKEQAAKLNPKPQPKEETNDEVSIDSAELDEVMYNTLESDLIKS